MTNNRPMTLYKAYRDNQCMSWCVDTTDEPCCTKAIVHFYEQDAEQRANVVAEMLNKTIMEAVAAEREACAKVADHQKPAWEIAREIRARGGK